MMSRKTLTDVLLQGLEDLEEQDFKKFIHKLSEFVFDDKPPIPRCNLEKADRIDAARLLKERYGQESAVDVAIKIFSSLNLNKSAVKLKHEKETALRPDRSANAYRVKYREHIQNKYSTIKDMNSRPGENVNLNIRYTKLIIVKGHRPRTQREHEIKTLGRRHAEIMTEHASPITIGNLFESDGNGQSPQIVVLLGAAGIGKTLTAKKIMLDWANGELYPSRFDYVFYINCREIKFGSEQRSVEDLILKNCPDHNAPTKEILMTPEKLLFIIDGFDEMRFSFNQPTSNLCSDPCEKQPVEIILSNLFRKKMLHKSYLLITTRPIALEKLQTFLKNERCAEILGFSEVERKEYFYKFFGNEEQARKAFNFVKDNEMLFTMCFVPIACWIICTALKQQMEAGEDLTKTSSTITGVYMHYLFSILKGHGSISKQQVQGNLKGLCSLAADGIWRKNILFEDKDIRKHGLDQPDSLFLNENMFHKDTDYECAYSFIHLSFQEFFAALFYVLEKEETVEDSEITINHVKNVLERYGEDYLLVVRFLFGSLNEETIKSMGKEMSCKFSPLIKPILLKWVKEKFELEIEHLVYRKFLQFEMFHCLFETQDKKIVQHAMNSFTELKIFYHYFIKLEQLVLSFCIKNSCKLESLCLDTCSFQTEDPNEDSPGPSKRPYRAQPQDEPHHSPIYLLCEALKASNCELKKLELTECRLRDTCCGDLARLLIAKQTLTHLNLTSSHLGDDGVWLLCEGLKDPNCKLQKLNLLECDLTETGCRYLAAVFRTNQRLTDLDLSANDLLDAGVRLLCEGLEHPSCKLQRLKLTQCRLRDTCCGDLSRLLIAKQTLTHLDLSYNNLGDSGAWLLYEGLKDPNCKLQELNLESCGLTDLGCVYLAAVLITSQSLSELLLGCNCVYASGMRLMCEGLRAPRFKTRLMQSLEFCDLTDTGLGDISAFLRTGQSLSEVDLSDTGMRLLCKGLKHPSCKLQRLTVFGCQLTDACGDLAAVLRTSQSLTIMELKHNYLGEAGVCQLCEGLKHPNCKLQRLSLQSCYLTSACCGDLAAALRTNQSLTELDLGHNELGDAGVQLLCEGLKQNCKLQTLDLPACDVTEPGCRALADVLRTRQSLTELKLTSNFSLGDSGMQRLCEGLKHPTCKLQRLELFCCKLSAACCGDLSSALITSQTLTFLDLKWNQLEESGVQLLCEALKHPNCQLQKIRVDMDTLEMKAELEAVKKIKPGLDIEVA